MDPMWNHWIDILAVVVVLYFLEKFIKQQVGRVVLELQIANGANQPNYSTSLEQIVSKLDDIEQVSYKLEDINDNLKRLRKYLEDDLPKLDTSDLADIRDTLRSLDGDVSTLRRRYAHDEDLEE